MDGTPTRRALCYEINDGGAALGMCVVVPPLLITIVRASQFPFVVYVVEVPLASQH